MPKHIQLKPADDWVNDLPQSPSPGTWWLRWATSISQIL